MPITDNGPKKSSPAWEKKHGFKWSFFEWDTRYIHVRTWTFECNSWFFTIPIQHRVPRHSNLNFSNFFNSENSCWTPDLAGHGHDIPTRVTATTPKKNQIRPFLSLKWRIYKYVRVRAVRFWFLTILIQRDSFYTQTIFWFSYFKKEKKKNLTL